MAKALPFPEDKYTDHPKSRKNTLRNGETFHQARFISQGGEPQEGGSNSFGGPGLKQCSDYAGRFQPGTPNTYRKGNWKKGKPGA